MTYPTLLLLLDGVGDEPLEELKNLTPLQSAHLPTLDKLAKVGQCGVADPVAPEKTANTTEGILSVLGYDPLAYSIGRGVIEAFGAELSLDPGDIALRGNLACMGEGDKIRDRRAGRIREGATELLQALEQIQVSSQVEFFIGAGTEHRFALVLRGTGLSDQIVGSDPKDRDPYGIRITPHAVNPDDVSAQRTANILDQFEQKAQQVLVKHPVNQKRIQQGLLPANSILTREPGILTAVPSFHIGGQPLRGVCISGDRTVLGVAKMANLEFYCSPRMTANLDTDLPEKFNEAFKRLNDYDLVLIHIKGCDIAAHDLQGKIKRDFLESIDQAFGEFLSKCRQAYEGEATTNPPHNPGIPPLRIGVVADHGTSSKKGYHISDPVPVIIYHPGLPADSVEGYDEIQASRGMLGRFRGYQFLEKLWYG